MHHFLDFLHQFKELTEIFKLVQKIQHGSTECFRWINDMISVMDLTQRDERSTIEQMTPLGRTKEITGRKCFRHRSLGTPDECGSRVHCVGPHASDGTGYICVRTCVGSIGHCRDIPRLLLNVCFLRCWVANPCNLAISVLLCNVQTEWSPPTTNIKNGVTVFQLCPLTVQL